MSDDELVEKVARAICAAEVEAGYSATPWDDPDNNRDWLRANARAALTAVDLPAVRAEAERAGAARALREAAITLRQDTPEGATLREGLGLTREENDLRGQLRWCATCGHYADRHQSGSGCAGSYQGVVEDPCDCKRWVREPVRVQVRSEWEPMPRAAEVESGVTAQDPS